MTNWNWPLIGHLIIGTIITTSQALATTYPTSTGLVNVCHIITLVVTTIGVSLGVWQSQQTTTTSLLGKVKAAVGIQSKAEPESVAAKELEPVVVKDTVEAKDAAKAE